MHLLPSALHLQYGTMSHRLEGRIVSPAHEGTSLSSAGGGTGLSDGSANDTQLSPSRSVPYDTDQRYAHLQRYGLVSRKSMTHFQEETQPLRRNMSSSGVESLGFGRKRKGIDSEDDNKLDFSELSDKSLTTKVAHGLNCVQPSSEDEDACPTCLDGNLMCLDYAGFRLWPFKLFDFIIPSSKVFLNDHFAEYTPENPKITTRCSHHFHLGCIYEWLERSESCPICGKVC